MLASPTTCRKVIPAMLSLRWSLLLLGGYCVVLGLALPTQPLHAEQPTPLVQAHAHNDYLHQRPLLDALDNGFCSVEADVFLVDGELLVAHTRSELSPDRTLQRLYLDPLRQRIQQGGGSVYGDGSPLTLLIDLKSDGEATYRALDAVLAKYSEMLATTEDGVHRAGPVVVIISGDRPIASVTADATRYVGIDGRLSDLESDQPVSLLPLISDNWSQHFKWGGTGRIPPDELKTLKDLVEKIHQQRRRVRFWATPDTPAAWQVLREAGVDLINTDDLEGLRKFLTAAK